MADRMKRAPDIRPIDLIACDLAAQLYVAIADHNEHNGRFNAKHWPNHWTVRACAT